MSTVLDQYNPATGIFKHFDINGGLVKNPVLKDRKGRLWIPTGNGLVRMDRKTGKIILPNLTL